MKNLEIKAKCGSLSELRERVQTLGAACHGTMRQVDTYFRVPNGRLKLRELGDTHAELIYYERPNQSGLRYSNYQICEIADAASFKTLMLNALTARVVVEKQRELWMYGDTRIHLDDVVGLGAFVELETVMRGQTEHDAYTEHDYVRTALDIQASAVVSVSYSDLLLSMQA